jgi:predicted TIM-barrel fold metal-dependent hydrolase
MAGVIDIDTHIIEHPGVWENFDEKLFQRRPVLASMESTNAQRGRDSVWMIDGAAIPKRTGKGSVALAVGGSESENARSDISTGVRYLTDPLQRVRDMDERGVEAEVVFPTLLLAYLTDVVELEVAICQAYNRYVANAWRQAGDRLRWVVVPPLRDIEASVKEIEWGRENGAVGVFFRGVEGDRSLADRYFDPVYTAADRLGMAICVHTGPGAPGITQVFDRTVSHNLPQNRALPLWAFRDLVAHKVPERFPNIRWGFIEASASWVPYVLHHLQRSTRASTQGASPDPTTEWGPRLFRDYKLYVATESDEDIAYLARFIGEDNIITGSDYGHQDQSRETNMVKLLRGRSDVSPEIIEKILTTNGARFYGLE